MFVDELLSGGQRRTAAICTGHHPVSRFKMSEGSSQSIPNPVSLIVLIWCFLLFHESPFDYVGTRFTTARRYFQTKAIEHEHGVFQHLRAAANHSAVFLGV